MYVAGFPRSGNTWLCYLLAYCLNTEYDDIDDPGIHPGDEYQRSYVKGGLQHPSFISEVGRVLKTHGLQIDNGGNVPVVYLVRDGRDVMVSYYFYINSQEGREVNDFDRAAFTSFVMQYTPQWILHVRTWLLQNPAAVVRYEDLHVITGETLSSLFARLGVDVSPPVIEKALDIFNFTRLSNRKAGEEDIKSFFRKGVVGDWKNYFSDSDSEYFQVIAGDILGMLGYSNVNSSDVKTQGLRPSKYREKAVFHARPIKVLHLCTHDYGGAGKAVYRLHKGLQEIGIDSTMLVLNKKSADSTVRVSPDDFSEDIVSCPDVPICDSPLWFKQANRWNALLSKLYPNRPDGLEIFTDAQSDVRLDLVKEVQEADIINLHWVAGMMDYSKAPLAIGEKVIVWTLHDMNPFTGGCHYAGTCEKYKKSCGACPQLGSESDIDLTRHIWKQKFNAYQGLNINIVTPSHWLGKCASESTLFADFPVNVIPNGLPLGVFKPYPKSEARKVLKIPESAKVVLFGADSIVNKRKGFKYLVDSLNKLAEKSRHDNIVLTFGHLPKGLKISSRYPVLNLGLITNEDHLAMVYSAADVFVIPSIEDNLPNTVIEAMSCGVPVVGFDVGGIPDMIEHKKTGYLVKAEDISGLTEGIDWVLSSYHSGTNLSDKCFEKVAQEYALETQAKAYMALYKDLLSSNKYLKVSEKEAFALNQEGEDLFMEGDLKGALNAFAKAIEIAPDFATAHNNLGVLCWQQGKVKEALVHFTKALKINPDEHDTILNCGNVLTSLGRDEAARKLYMSYLRANPDDEKIAELLSYHDGRIKI